ncbi:MAG TPA: hypothetical protein VNF47_14410 [Streptosporangiaceae bacterium]|nr:hypothetical protein [Streptosporangiaceae bacterium]
MPKSIRLAVNLMYAGAILTGLGVAIIVILAVAAGSTAVGLGTRGHVTVATVAVVLLVSGLIEIGLWLWMAWAVKRGMAWARVVSTILFGINVLLTLTGVARGGSGAISGFVVLVIGLVAIIQLWKQESTAFFAASRTY